MFRAIAQAVASLLALLEWRAKNETLRLLLQVNETLHDAKNLLYQLEDSGATGSTVDLARLRVSSLQHQAELIASAEASYHAARIPTPAEPTPKK